MLSLASDAWSCGIRKIKGEAYVRTGEGCWKTIAEMYFNSEGRAVANVSSGSPWHTFYSDTKNNFINCWLMTHSVERKVQIGDQIVAFFLDNKLGTVSISEPVTNPVHEDRPIVVYTFNVNREAFSEYARQVHANKKVST